MEKELRKKELTLREFAAAFSAGEFDNPCRSTQIRAGWSAWFCRDSALARKTQSLGKKVLSIMDSLKIDKDTNYVFFKSICPCVGPFYDQFSICDIKSGEVLFAVQHLEKGSHGAEKARWEVFDANNGFQVPVVHGTWNEVKKWFNNK